MHLECTQAEIHRSDIQSKVVNKHPLSETPSTARHISSRQPNGEKLLRVA